MIRRASSRVSSVATDRRARLILEIDNTAVWPGVCLSIARVPSECLRWCCRGAIMMKQKVTRTASFSLFFLLSGFAPAHAQVPPPEPTEPPSRLSIVAHDFGTWLSHVTGTRRNDHQADRHSPPLPRPRAAAERGPKPVASNKEWSEFVPPSGASKKETSAPVQIND